ncbi:GNAT family N-acetyltransferase [Nannocystaceae bacterium ST9]
MFCDLELAARIERAECRLVADACANVAWRIADVLVAPIGAGLAAFVEPNSPLDKVVGLGFGEFDEAAFVAFEQAMAERGAAVQVELATLADPSVGKWLTGRGYALVGVENVLGRGLPLADARASAGEIAIADSGADEFESWLGVMVDGFLAPDVQGLPSHEQFEREVMESTMRDFTSARGVVRYLARSANHPIGAAAMRSFEGVAQLCGAATLPEHRRRGVQSSLLERRLIDAGRQGCTVAVVTTSPGSKSQQNVQRQGFALLYARNILRREP